MAFKDIFIDFAGWTSSHGMPRIKGAANQVWRAFWILVTLACVAMLIWNLQMIAAKYLKYGVSVTPEFTYTYPKFPAVSMTNLNSYLNSRTVGSGVNLPFGDMDNDYRLQMETITQGAAPSRTASSEWNYFNFNKTTTTILLQAQARIELAYAAGDLSKQTRLGYSSSTNRSSLVISCVYDGIVCQESDWEQISSSTYAYGYTFNSDGYYSSVRPGPANGLRVMFRTDQSEYQAWVESAGMRVVIHNSDEYEFLTSFGYYASVGLSTNIAVKMITRIRLPSPYGDVDCVNEPGSRSYYLTGKYTVEGCSRSCIQDAVVKACGCSHPLYPYVGTASKCSFNHTTNYHCAITTADSVNAQLCDCPERCQQDTYSMIISTSKWPGPNYIPAQCYKSPLTNPNGIPYWTQGNIQDCRNWFGNNTGILTVYYETLDVKILQETISYTLLSMITDFGGQLGLWIGGSVIVVFEYMTFLVLVVLFLVSKCIRCYHKNKKNKTDPIEELNEKTNAKENTRENQAAESDQKQKSPDVYGRHSGGVTPPILST